MGGVLAAALTTGANAEPSIATLFACFSLSARPAGVSAALRPCFSEKQQVWRSAIYLAFLNKKNVMASSLSCKLTETGKRKKYRNRRYD
ncbi:hypothetical protein [Domibacillus iocasae]|uniref:Uncharacterized protein n=1 Tax=Domibacillus iocasae TaxID=1714016 RepID=A0A1E7DT06_9BACI|nr:hypothetical protein [Domibacillus iocasae]OES46145.1 hypothetical protein BA724_16330 [Domibacillus iocasae]